jgi:tetratricopeptide (TPR) repeat protein
MEALLEALGRDPTARRRRRGLVGVVALVVLALVGLAYGLWPGSPRTRCRGAGERLDEVWDEAGRARLRAAWPREGRRAALVIEALDRYGAAWKRERVKACEATFVEGEQSEQLLDRRMFCLDRRLGAMRALVEGLRRGKVAPGAAAQAAARLPRLEECRDREALAEVVPPPAGSRKAIAAVLARLDRADTRGKLGEPGAALAEAKAALKRARQLGYKPVVAQASYVVGFLTARTTEHARAEKHFRAAIRLAAAAKAHHLEATAWLSLIHYVGHIADRTAPALALAPAAEAAVARAPGDPVLRARLDSNLGLILFSKGDYRAARTKLEAARRAFEKILGPDDLDTAVARNNLAMVLEKLGEHKRAYALLERVLKVRQRVFGADHPAVATALNDMGNTAQSLGQLARARTHLERALKIRRATLGQSHPRTAHTLNNLAIVLGDLGQHAQAAAHARRAVEVAERAFGKNHPELAGPLNTLGNQLRELGQSRGAWEAYARGLAIVEWAKGRDHIAIAPMVENLARMLAGFGKLDQALQYIDRAIAVRLGVQGPAGALNAVALRGSFNLQNKQPAAAVKDFERQRSLAIKGHNPDHEEVAQAEYNIAVALEQGGELKRAAEQYRKALATFARGAPGHRLSASAWRGLGDVAVARGDLVAAPKHYEQAARVAAAVGDRTRQADYLHLLGGVHARARRYPQAVAAFTRAVEARPETGDKALLALDEFALARVLRAGRIDRARALKLARHARRLFVAAGARAEDNVAQLDAWLRKAGR